MVSEIFCGIFPSTKGAEDGQKAAALDTSEAILALGMAYFSGFGVSQNEEERVRWLLDAAALENLDAMYRLGFVYEQRQASPEIIRKR